MEYCESSLFAPPFNILGIILRYLVKKEKEEIGTLFFRDLIINIFTSELNIFIEKIVFFVINKLRIVKKIIINSEKSHCGEKCIGIYGKPVFHEKNKNRNRLFYHIDLYKLIHILTCNPSTTDFVTKSFSIHLYLLN